MKTEDLGKFQVESDGQTVWVHDQQGTCIGRFSKAGIDIHKDLQGQLTGEQCLDCKPIKFSERSTETFRKHWKMFVGSMIAHYGVEINEKKHTPVYVKAGY